jgi:hypothetical protein
MPGRFMSIPVDMARAIVSIPAELIQFRIDLSTKQEELSKAEMAQLEALEELRQAIEQRPTGNPYVGDPMLPNE